jgi:hypothetical protein
MKANWFGRAVTLASGFVALAALACSSEPPERTEEAGEELASGEQALMSCSNPDGTNSVMAAFAVAVAQDLGRWNASKDFVVNLSNGMSESSWGSQQTIKLASGSDASGPIGKSRCRDGKCARVQALLDLQYEQASNKVYVQGSGSTRVLLNPSALRSRMFAKWQEQIACDKNAKDGDVTACTREQNSLVFVGSAKGGCDTNFTFAASSPTGAALKYPNQLKNELQFADASNPYINFQNLGNGRVSIDPGMLALFELVGRAAQRDLSVLILGETGVGKELIAETVHERSPRAQRRFFALNCAALPENLVESELFGHERGAFTGAHTARPACWRRATAGRCSWMKLESCRSARKPSCSGCWRTAA